MLEAAGRTYSAVRMAFRYFAGFIGLIVVGVTQILYGWAGEALWLRVLYPAACFVMSIVCLAVCVHIVRRLLRGDYLRDEE